MRFLARALGLFLAAGTFVDVVVDGTRSIADNAFVYLSISDFWNWLSAPSFARAQGWVEVSLSPFVWSRVALPVLSLPFACLLLVLAALLLWLSRRPASRIGYVSHL